MQTTCIEQELAHDLLNLEFGNHNPRYKWEYIGEGSYRMAFRGEDGKVYKIPLETYEDYIAENEDEYKNYLRIKELPPFTWKGNKWIAPEMQLFTFPSFGEFDGPNGPYNLSVIVTSFVNGEPLEKCLDGCGAKTAMNCIECEQANLYYGMYDLSNDNVLVQPDGTRVMIDLQC